MANWTITECKRRNGSCYGSCSVTVRFLLGCCTVPVWLLDGSCWPIGRLPSVKGATVPVQHASGPGCQAPCLQAFFPTTCWAGLGWAGLGWAGLGWAGLGWAGLGWAGLGQGSVDLNGRPAFPLLRESPIQLHGGEVRRLLQAAFREELADEALQPKLLQCMFEAKLSRQPGRGASLKATHSR